MVELTVAREELTMKSNQESEEEEGGGGVVSRTIGTGAGWRLLRQKRGWTQMRLAQESGVRLPGISNYETGRLFPSSVTMAKLLEALGATVVDLYLASKEAGGEMGAAPKDGAGLAVEGGAEAGRRQIEALTKVIIKLQRELDEAKRG